MPPRNVHLAVHGRLSQASRENVPSTSICLLGKGGRFFETLASPLLGARLMKLLKIMAKETLTISRMVRNFNAATSGFGAMAKGDDSPAWIYARHLV